MRVSFVGLILLVLLAPEAGSAQSPDLGVAPWMKSPHVQSVGVIAAHEVLSEGGRATPWLVFGGVVGGGVGLVGGMFTGALIDGAADEDCRDFCFGPGLILGTLAGEALGVALGVHLANRRSGSLPAGLLTSAGILALGLWLGNNQPMSLLVVPVSQLIGTISVERATGR